jgi:hypothetical protein
VVKIKNNIRKVVKMVGYVIIKSMAKIYARAIRRGSKTIHDVIPPEFQNDVRTTYLELFGTPCPEPAPKED